MNYWYNKDKGATKDKEEGLNLARQDSDDSNYSFVDTCLSSLRWGFIFHSIWLPSSNSQFHQILVIMFASLSA